MGPTLLPLSSADIPLSCVFQQGVNTQRRILIHTCLFIIQITCQSSHYVHSSHLRAPDRQPAGTIIIIWFPRAALPLQVMTRPPPPPHPLVHCTPGRHCPRCCRVSSADPTTERYRSTWRTCRRCTAGIYFWEMVRWIGIAKV